MDVFPAVFSAFLPAHDVQSGEHYMSAALFYQDSVSIDIDQGAASARCNGNPKQTWERREGMDKKFLHREIERGRRNDMKSRYSQLMSLLPQTNTKVKASICDQLSEATEYIRHLQEKVDELAKQRDYIKVKKNEEQQNKEDNAILFNECEGFPAVNVNYVGSCVTVTANTLRSKQMALSKLLFAIEEEGLQILTVSSFVTDDKVFYALQCKVQDLQSFNGCAKLRQKTPGFNLIGQKYIEDA